MFEKTSRFDWYQATVPASVALVRETLSNTLEPAVQPRPCPPRFGYKLGLVWHVEATGEDLAFLFWGGHNLHPHVLATSENAPALAASLSYVFPDHRVSRADVCVDLSEPGLFDRCAAIMTEVSRRYPRVQFTRYGPGRDDDPSKIGSTLYLGSPSSPVRLVLYEKGKELYAKTGDKVWVGVEEFLHWTRLEIRVRPEKAFKSEAARLAPAKYWGLTAWASEAAQAILDLKPEAIRMKPTRIADHDRAMRALYTQYGTTLRRHLERLGSREAFLADLMRSLELPEAA